MQDLPFMESLQDLWGSGEELDPLQMAVRAFVMFFIMLLLLRLAGKRLFGHKTAIDNVVTIMIGAVTARGVIGASPFWSTVAAATVMVLLEKILSWIALKSEALSRLLNGKRVLLYARGRVQRDNLKRVKLSESDLHASLRLETHHTSLAEVDEAYLETNGRISFISR